MRKYLLPVLLFVTAFVVVFTDVSAQTVEVQVLTNDGMFSSTGTGANCRACDNDVPNHQVRLRYVFGSTSGEAGYNASPGCGVYSASGPVGTNPITSVSAQNYGTTATIQLSGEDTRSCGSGDISWDNASTGATFTHTAIAPGGTYSSLYTSTRTAGTSTTGTRWQFRWRYVTAGSAGTLTVPTGNSYCSGSLPGTLTINGTAATGAAVGGVIYEWSYSFDGYSTIIGSGQNLSIPFPSTGYTYRRRTKWRSNYDNVSPAYVTADASTTITVSSPPTGSVVTPINACSGGTVSTTISGYSAGSGSATIEVRDPLNVLVYSGTSPSISFDAPVTLGVPNQTVSYSVTALPSGSACTTPVNLGTLVVNYYEGSKAPDSIQVSPGTTICEGTSLTLTARGARLGYGGARYEWSTSPSFGTIIHTSTTDSTYTTGPVDSSITYYARIGNVTTPGSVCSPFTGNASKLITVIDSTLPPTSVTPGTATYCEGSGVPVVLNQVGGSLGTGAVWQWSTEPTFTTGVIPSASGPTLNVLPGTGSFPAATTTYYVRGINNTAPCSPTSDYASAVVEFSEESEAPTGITLSTNGVCQGTSIDLTLVGGSLGAGAQWYWYANSCGGTPIDSGVSITVTPSTSTSYFVRAEGDCNITDCADDYVLIFEPAEDPDSIAFEPVLCIDSYSEVSLSVVGGVLGTGMDWFWYSDVSLDDIYEVGSGTTINVDPFTYPELWMIAKSDGSLGAIPAPCPATTTPLYADLRTVTFEVYPVMNDLYADEDVFCDSGTPTLYADGVLDGYDYDFNTVVSPFAQYMLYDEDPALNPSAVALDSNTTGIFASVYTDTTTIYYVVVRNSCGISNVMSVPITINYSSVAPTEFTLVSQDSICNGDATNVTLTVNGTLGTDAIYEWSTDEFATVDNLLGNTNTINVSPTSTTTYSVRINNTAAPCTDVSAEVIDYTITVTEPSIAPTALTASADSICNGDLTDVTITADGTLGTDAVYEWSTDGFATVDSGLGNTNTIVVSPTATTTYSARISGPAPCSDVSGTVVSTTVTVMEPSDAPTALVVSADTLCNGANVTITADGTLGTDAVYEWSTDGFATVDGGLGSSNTIVVSPTTTTTYSARISGPTPCADISATEVSATVTVIDASTAPASITVSDPEPCYNESIQLTQIGGALNSDVAYFEWATDAAFTNIIDTSSSSTISVIITEPTEYYVRIVNPVCATTSAASVSVDWVQASDVVFGDNLTNTSTIASTCSIDDNDWHYFVDEEGDVVAAINSNGQDLGQVVWTVSVGDNGPFTNPNNTLCTAGEYHVARKYSFMTENQATSPVGIRLFITPGEYASHKAISDAQDAMYAVCWGTTSTAADLQVSAFYAHDNGALGVGISPSASLNVGPGGSHQYQFSVLPNYGGGGRLDPNGRNNPANNTEFYIHNTGGRSSVLPVELTSFTATKVTEGVLLNWNTASELNNDRFEVTRSTDGVNFETIGYVSGMGTTNNPQQYSFLDKDVASGVYYYQLRQVDFDGTAELSKIVSVEITAETVLNVGLFFPNPAQRVSSVVVNSPDNANIVFTLYSIDGKQALNKVYSLARGENRIDVDLNNVPAGSYISIFQTQGQIINRKLIVQE